MRRHRQIISSEEFQEYMQKHTEEADVLKPYDDVCIAAVLDPLRILLCGKDEKAVRARLGELQKGTRVHITQISSTVECPSAWFD